MFVQAFVGKTRRDVDALVDDMARRQNTTRDQWLAARPGAIVGTADEAAARFAILARAGIDHANVMLPYGHELEGVSVLSEVARA